MSIIAGIEFEHRVYDERADVRPLTVAGYPGTRERAAMRGDASVSSIGLATGAFAETLAFMGCGTWMNRGASNAAPAGSSGPAPGAPVGDVRFGPAAVAGRQHWERWHGAY
jgi:hypothetical protein